MFNPLNNRRNKTWLSLGLGIGLSLVWSPVAPASSSNKAENIMPQLTKQGYGYLSGGVGVEERHLMRQQAHLYDLELSFADRSGNYLSDVKVVIDDEHGKQIIDTVTNGPWLYVDLPTGKYNIEATFDGQTEQINGLVVSNEHPAVRLLHWSGVDRRISQR